MLIVSPADGVMALKYGFARLDKKWIVICKIRCAVTVDSEAAVFYRRYRLLFWLGHLGEPLIGITVRSEDGSPGLEKFPYSLPFWSDFDHAAANGFCDEGIAIGQAIG